MQQCCEKALRRQGEQLAAQMHHAPRPFERETRHLKHGQPITSQIVAESMA